MSRNPKAVRFDDACKVAEERPEHLASAPGPYRLPFMRCRSLLLTDSRSFRQAEP